MLGYAVKPSEATEDGRTPSETSSAELWLAFTRQKALGTLAVAEQDILTSLRSFG